MCITGVFASGLRLGATQLIRSEVPKRERKRSVNVEGGGVEGVGVVGWGGGG